MNPEGDIPLLYSLASPDHDKIVKQGVKLDSDGTFWVPEESVNVSLLKYMSQTTREILIAKNTSIEFSGGETNSPTARSMDGVAAVPSSSSSPDERKKMEKKKKKSKKKKSKKTKPSLPKSPGPNEKKTSSSFLKQRKESASSDYSDVSTSSEEFWNLINSIPRMGKVRLISNVHLTTWSSTHISL